MSAWIVEKSTIDKVVCLFKVVRHGRSHAVLPVEHWDELGSSLWSMNYAAVRSRYPDETNLHLPGYKFTRALSNKVVIDQFVGFNELPLPMRVDMIKAADCLRYQCSEGSVPETALYVDLKKLVNEACKLLVQSLPEYDAAPWE